MGSKFINIKLEGADKLAKALKSMNTGAIEKVVKMNGAELQQKAMKSAPADTGYLRRSITLEIQDKGMTAKVEPYASYAPYVEWGTRFMRARPFLWTSWNVQRLQFEHDLRRLVQ